MDVDIAWSFATPSGWFVQQAPDILTLSRNHDFLTHHSGFFGIAHFDGRSTLGAKCRQILLVYLIGRHRFNQRMQFLRKQMQTGHYSPSSGVSVELTTGRPWRPSNQTNLRVRDPQPIG